MNRTCTLLQALVLLPGLIWANQPLSACGAAWFGKICQYKCQCDEHCLSTGRCQKNSKCLPGWFGVECQYQDLANLPTASLSTFPKSTSSLWLTDNNASTCNTDPQLKTIIVKWAVDYIFTWLEVTIAERCEDDCTVPSLPTSLEVQFVGSKEKTNLSCSNKEVLKQTDYRFEIHCEVRSSVSQMTIEVRGSNRLCSLHVSGGRNIALRQTAAQSSSFVSKDGVNHASFLAIDGNTDPRVSEKSCTQTTENDPHPVWNLTLDHEYRIIRFLVYNRKDPIGDDLINFNTLGFNSTDDVVFNYTHSRSANQLVYGILNVGRLHLPMKKFSISPKVEKPTRILSLCEVEIFGDCPPGTWGLACWNCSSKCYNRSCSRDSGICNKGCLGYKNAPYCTEDCLPGFWGFNCREKCKSNNCSSDSCDKQTGRCDQESDLPDCGGNQPCENTTRLVNATCDRPGVYGDMCNEECTNCGGKGYCLRDNGFCISGCVTGHSGPNCNLLCMAECVDTVCHQTTRHCTLGCLAGFSGQFCNKSCMHCAGDRSCDQNTMHCSRGCQRGFIGPTCAAEATHGFRESILYPVIVPVLGITGVVLMMSALWHVHLRDQSPSDSDDDDDDDDDEDDNVDDDDATEDTANDFS